MTIDQRESFGRHAWGVALFLFAGLIGLSLPDVDLSLYWLRHFGLMEHRSALTHSALLPFFVFLAAHARTRTSGLPGSEVAAERALPLRFLAIGLCLAVSLHLCFDLFPRGWYGYALVHVPFYGGLGPWLSALWLLLSLVICIHMAVRLLRNQGEMLLCCLGIMLWFGLHAVREPRAAWFVPFAFLPAAFVGFVLPWPKRRLSTPTIRI